MGEWQTQSMKREKEQNPVNKTVNNSKDISREPLADNTIKNKDFSIVKEQLILQNRLPKDSHLLRVKHSSKTMRKLCKSENILMRWREA